jgi:hypothetical protein
MKLLMNEPTTNLNNGLKPPNKEQGMNNAASLSHELKFKSDKNKMRHSMIQQGFTLKWYKTQVATVKNGTMSYLTNYGQKKVHK